MDQLTAEEHRLGLSWRLNNMFLVLQFGAHGHDNLANVNPSHCALGLSKDTLHTCLEFIGPSTGQKIVDEFPGEDWCSACKQSLIAYSSLSRGEALWELQLGSPSFSNLHIRQQCAITTYSTPLCLDLHIHVLKCPQTPLYSLVSQRYL